MTAINKLGAQPIRQMNQNPSFGNAQTGEYYIVMNQPGAKKDSFVKESAKEFVAGGIVGAVWSGAFNIGNVLKKEITKTNALKTVGKSALSWGAAFVLINAAFKFAGKLFGDK